MRKRICHDSGSTQRSRSLLAPQERLRAVANGSHLTAGGDQSDLDTRAVRGIRSLLIRQVCLQLISMVGSITLARLLDPKEFGMFAVVSVCVVLISYFGDFGIAPSFIQRRNELMTKDLQVGFTLQLGLTAAIVALLFVAAPWLSDLLGSSYPDVTWLIRALALSLFMTTGRAMSA